MSSVELAHLQLPWRLFGVNWDCRNSNLELMLVPGNSDVTMIGLGGARTGSQPARSSTDRPGRVAVRFRGVRDLEINLPAGDAVIELEISPGAQAPAALSVRDKSAQSAMSFRCKAFESSEIAPVDVPLTLAFDPDPWHVTLRDGGVMTVWATSFSESEIETVFETWIEGLPVKTVEVLRVPNKSVKSILSGPEGQVGSWR